MKTFKLLALLFLIVSTLSGNLLENYNLAVNINKLDETNQNKVKRVALKTMEELSKSLGKKVNITFVLDNKTLLEDFYKFNKYNMIINYSSFYLENKEKIIENSVNPFLFYNNSNQKTQYYLIANKKSKIKTILDLKDKNFTSLSIDSNYATWVDYLLRKQFNTSYKNIINKTKIVHKNERLLLDVYFEKVDFTAVSKVVYDDVSLLNPAVKRNLVIVEKSEPIFFFAIGFFHKNTPKNLVEKFQEIIDNGEFNKKLGNMFRLLNMYDIHKASFEELEPLHGFYDEYLKLKMRK